MCRSHHRYMIVKGFQFYLSSPVFSEMGTATNTARSHLPGFLDLSQAPHVPPDPSLVLVALIVIKKGKNEPLRKRGCRAALSRVLEWGSGIPVPFSYWGPPSCFLSPPADPSPASKPPLPTPLLAPFRPPPSSSWSCLFSQISCAQGFLKDGCTGGFVCHLSTITPTSSTSTASHGEGVGEGVR